MPSDQYRVSSDPYLVSARELRPHMTDERLAQILRRIDEISRQRDAENRQSALIISALLELLGGQVFLPKHALEDSPGFEISQGEHSGDLLIHSAPSHG